MAYHNRPQRNPNQPQNNPRHWTRPARHRDYFRCEWKTIWNPSIQIASSLQPPAALSTTPVLQSSFLVQCPHIIPWSVPRTVRWWPQVSWIQCPWSIVWRPQVLYPLDKIQRSILLHCIIYYTSATLLLLHHRLKYMRNYLITLSFCIT